MTSETVDLTGWTIVTGGEKVFDMPAETLSPRDRIVVEFPGSFLKNKDESVTLKDAQGTVRNRVSLIDDTSNDDKTCQRSVDGMSSWGLYAGTPGEKNKGGLFGKDGSITKACFDILVEAATDTMEEMGGKITTEEQL